MGASAEWVEFQVSHHDDDLEVVTEEETSGIQIEFGLVKKKLGYIQSGAPQGILGPMKIKNIDLYFLMISIRFSIFWGPCQSWALRIVLVSPPIRRPCLQYIHFVYECSILKRLDGLSSSW